MLQSGRGTASDVTAHFSNSLLLELCERRCEAPHQHHDGHLGPFAFCSLVRGLCLHRRRTKGLSFAFCLYCFHLPGKEVTQ